MTKTNCGGTGRIKRPMASGGSCLPPCPGCMYCKPDKSPGVDCDATSSKAEGVEGLPDPRQVLDDMESLVQNAYEMKLVMATYLIAHRTLANERDEAVRIVAGLENVIKITQLRAEKAEQRATYAEGVADQMEQRAVKAEGEVERLKGDFIDLLGCYDVLYEKHMELVWEMDGLKK